MGRPVKYLLAFVLIGTACSGCSFFGNDTGQDAGAADPGTGNTAQTSAPELAEPRRAEPFAPTEEQVAQVEALTATLTDAKTEPVDRQSAREKLIALGPPACRAMLALVQNDRTGKVYYPFAVFFFSACGDAGKEYLLWAQESDQNDERKASYRILRGLTHAKVAFVENADTEQRNASVEEWEEVLAQENTSTP